jgi:riboflavin kinase/FMN adenylyltransferase
VKIYNLLEDIEFVEEPVVMSIGVFDGLHKGHNDVFDYMQKIGKEKGARPWILTFSNLPEETLIEGFKYGRLMEPGYKVSLLEKKEIDGLILIDFSKKFANIKAVDFCNLLQSRFKNLNIVVGFDFTLGKGAEMNVAGLKKQGDVKGFNVYVDPAFTKDGIKVSSTWIRSLIREGNVDLAKELLTRFYCIEGEVKSRDSKGREIGFPTTNIRNKDMVYPKEGAYFTGIALETGDCDKYGYKVFDKRIHYSMTFVGTNSLSDDKEPTIETNIFDFKGNLYNKWVRVFFYKRLRDTIEFPDYNDLRKQLKKDKENCLRLIEEMEEINAT